MKTTTKTVDLWNFKNKIVINEEIIHVPKTGLSYKLNLGVI